MNEKNYDDQFYRTGVSMVSATTAGVPAADIASPGGNHVVAVVGRYDVDLSSDTTDVKVQVFNADATPDGSNVVISEPCGKTQYSVEFANLAGNTIAATWSDFYNVAFSRQALTPVFEAAS
jgi:hypothetical protein